MHFLVYLVAVSVTSLVAASAHAQDRCESLFRKTCAPPSQDVTSDPTGTVLGFDDAREYRRLFEANAAKFNVQGTALARASLSDGTFRALLSSLGLDKAAICRARSKEAKCVELAGATLGQLLMVDLSNKRAGHVELGRVPLESLLALVQGERYQKAEKTLSEELLAASDPRVTREAADFVKELRSEVVAAARRFLPETRETAALLEKVLKVEYADDRCPPMLFGSQLSAVAQIGAFYDPDLNKVRICRGLASSVTSRFALATVLAHEITHSIDPCTIRTAAATTATNSAATATNASSNSSHTAAAATLTEYDASSPWSALSTCLRDPRAMDAKSFATELSTARCREDQLVEAIPDFIAAEVVGSLIAKGKLPASTPDEAERGLANAWRIGCGSPDMGGNDPHATIEFRIERTLALQPRVRAALACGPVPQKQLYCGSTEARLPTSPRAARSVSSLEPKARAFERRLTVRAQLGETYTEIVLGQRPKSGASRYVMSFGGAAPVDLSASDFDTLFRLAQALPRSTVRPPARGLASCDRGTMSVALEPADGKQRSVCLLRNSREQRAYSRLAEALRWQRLR